MACHRPIDLYWLYECRAIYLLRFMEWSKTFNEVSGHYKNSIVLLFVKNQIVNYIYWLLVDGRTCQWFQSSISEWSKNKSFQLRIFCDFVKVFLVNLVEIYLLNTFLLYKYLMLWSPSKVSALGLKPVRPNNKNNVFLVLALTDFLKAFFVIFLFAL